MEVYLGKSEEAPIKDIRKLFPNVLTAQLVKFKHTGFSSEHIGKGNMKKKPKQELQQESNS